MFTIEWEGDIHCVHYRQLTCENKGSSNTTISIMYGCTLCFYYIRISIFDFSSIANIPEI